MSIVSSAHTVGVAGPDGLAHVEERHTDSTGRVHVVRYWAADGTDYIALRTARVAYLEQMLADEEAAAKLGD